MFFIFLVVFETMTASFVVEDRDTCRALQALNRAYWDEQGLHPRTLCMPSFEI